MGWGGAGSGGGGDSQHYQQPHLIILNGSVPVSREDLFIFHSALHPSCFFFCLLSLSLFFIAHPLLQDLL